MTMLHGQHREVRYAVPKQIHPEDVDNGVVGPDTLVPILSEPAVSLTEGLPVSRWIPGGFFPAKALVRLYVPEEET